MALSHHQAGRLAEAEGLYRRVLADHPRHARAAELLGALAAQTGRNAVALDLLSRAAALDPSSPSVQTNLAESLRRAGKYDEAIAACERAIALDPHQPVAHNNLGVTLAEKGEYERAAGAYRRAIELKADYAEPHSNLASALRESGQYTSAAAAAQRAVDLAPRVAANHNNLGTMLMELGQEAQAAAAYRRAIELDPHYADAWSNLGNALTILGDEPGALAALERATLLDPRAVQFHWNFAVGLLRAGLLDRAWREYEWRWEMPATLPRPRARFQPRRFPSSHWDGRPLSGKTILLHAEQGLGDTIQFCRYAPMTAGRGARVIMEVQPELRRLFANGLFGVDQVFERGEALPPFDEHCPLMSLPLAFRTDARTVPAHVPYLTPDASLVERWRRRVDQSTGKPKVGLCWAGSGTHQDDRNRSIPLAEFAALAACDVTFHSLQKGPAAAEAAMPPVGLRMVDHATDLTDFAETAALVSHLDLVVTVDTAVAHLAGAMGKPTWILLSSFPDWRWLMQGADSAWYPSARLFRQEKRRVWRPVLESVALCLCSHFSREYGTGSSAV